MPGGLRRVVAIAVVMATLCGGAAATSSSGRAVRQLTGIPGQLVVTGNRDGDMDVYSIRADGRRVGALTRNRVAEADVLLSPVGGWVALSREGARGGLVLVRADGRRERRLGAEAGRPVFSPDGRWLAFDFRQGTRIELAEVGRDRPSRTFGRGAPIRFSADGRRLAYVDGGNVGVLEVASGRRTRVARYNQERLDPYEFDWSPQLTGFVLEREADGGSASELVYFPARNGSIPRVIARGAFGLSRWLDERTFGYERSIAGGGREISEIVAARVDGTSRRVIARGSGIGFVGWAPGGEHVAYTARDKRAVVIASTTTPAERTIELGAGQTLTGINWSPSGRRLALTATVGAGHDLLLVDVGTRTTPRRFRGQSGSGYWSPDETTLAREDGSEGFPGVFTLVRLIDLRSGRSVTWPGGNTTVIGWMPGRQPPTVPVAAPAPPTAVATSTGFRSRTRVLELASDGSWVGALLEGGPLDRSHVVAWTPGRATTIRFARTSPGEEWGGYQQLSLSGTRLRWAHFGCGNDCFRTECEAHVSKSFSQRCGEEAPYDSDPPKPPPPPAETKRGLSITVARGLIKLRSAGGRSRTIRPPGRLADAELENTGLFYAFNTTGTFRGQVVFIPFQKLIP